jgi:hypothetical protein
MVHALVRRLKLQQKAPAMIGSTRWLRLAGLPPLGHRQVVAEDLAY